MTAVVPRLPPPALGERSDQRLEAVRPDSDAPGPDSKAGYAGLVTRAIAIMIDAVLIDMAALAVTGAVLLVRSVFNVSRRHHGLASAVGLVLFSVWVAGYFCFFWSTTGQTPGSRVMQIRVTRVDGTRVRLRGAFIRLAGMVLSLPLFWGYVPILWTPRRRGVCDVLAGTVVTVSPPNLGTARGARPQARGSEPRTTVPRSRAD